MNYNRKEEEDEEDDEFFDAQNYFAEDLDQIKKNLKKKRKKTDIVSNSLSGSEKKPSSDWFGLRNTINSVANRLGGVQPFEANVRPKVQQMIISIKNEAKNEFREENKVVDKLNEQQMDEQNPKASPTEHKTVKLEMTTDEKELEPKKTELTIINENKVKIFSDDIEMSSEDSVWFLVLMTVAIILDMFIICGVCHWIYTYLDGLDWYMEYRIQFNFHIFFMTLGICSFGFGLLVHRIFRGWSSGALNFLHTTITLITLIFFLIGIYAVVISLNHLGCVHFFSVHSWLGFISILLFAFLWISGIVIFVFPSFVYDMQLLIIPVHSLFGRIVFSIVCSTAIIGFSNKLTISDKAINQRINTLLTNSNNGINSLTWNQIVVKPVIKSNNNKLNMWQMPAEALVLNIIAIAVFIYLVLVNSISSNNKFRRRLQPEEMGIDIRTNN